MTKPQKKAVLSFATQAVALSEAVQKLHAAVEELSGKIHIDAFGKCVEVSEEETRLMDGAGERLMHAEDLLLQVNDFLCGAIGESVPKEEKSAEGSGK